MSDTIFSLGDITIRPITNIDTDLILKWRNSKEVKERFIFRGELTREMHENWLVNKVYTGQAHQFIIEKTVDKLPIGSVYLRDVDTVFNKAEFGIFIGDLCQTGHGYGTMATNLILKYAFENLKLHKVFLRVLADNPNAIKSYNKAGFITEGYFKDEIKLDDKYIDVVFMAIFNEGEK